MWTLAGGSAGLTSFGATEAWSFSTANEGDLLTGPMTCDLIGSCLTTVPVGSVLEPGQGTASLGVSEHFLPKVQWC